MKNPLTIQVETYLGCIFITGLTLFFILMIYGAVKDFEAETTILQSRQIKLRNLE